MNWRAKLFGNFINTLAYITVAVDLFIMLGLFLSALFSIPPLTLNFGRMSITANTSSKIGFFTFLALWTGVLALGVIVNQKRGRLRQAQE